jgi:hypothetical protein
MPNPGSHHSSDDSGSAGASADSSRTEQQLGSGAVHFGVAWAWAAVSSSSEDLKDEEIQEEDDRPESCYGCGEQVQEGAPPLQLPNSGGRPRRPDSSRQRNLLRGAGQTPLT